MIAMTGSDLKIIRLGKVLCIKKKYLKLIFSGKKTTTIRRGIIKPKHRRVYLHSGGKIVGELEIKSVKYLTVKDLTERDARKDGFENKEELLDGLKKFYPDLNEDDYITILEFKLVK
ncbi:MAG: hypothetical protein DRJ34_01490 [Thermoprotei archaeon]|nr:MAG: hypothetical protein DRJ34_01490 [Thermoprotei archaeon]